MKWVRVGLLRLLFYFLVESVSHSSASELPAAPQGPSSSSSSVVCLPSSSGSSPASPYFHGWCVRIINQQAGDVRSEQWPARRGAETAVQRKARPPFNPSLTLIVGAYQRDKKQSVKDSHLQRLSSYSQHYVFVGFSDENGRVEVRHFFPTPSKVKVLLPDRQMNRCDTQRWECADFGFLEIRRDGSGEFAFDDGKGFKVRGEIRPGVTWAARYLGPGSMLLQKKKDDDADISNDEREKEADDDDDDAGERLRADRRCRLSTAAYRDVRNRSVESWVRRLPLGLLPCHYDVKAMACPSSFSISYCTAPPSPLRCSQHDEPTEAEQSCQSISGVGKSRQNSSQKHTATPCTQTRRFRRALGRCRCQYSRKFEGLGHVENNWGEAFPQGWLWAQGVCRPAGSTADALPPHFLIAAGRLHIRPFSPKFSFTIAYRSPDVRWDFCSLDLDALKLRSCWSTRTVRLLATSRRHPLNWLLPEPFKLERFCWRRCLDVHISAPHESFTDPPVFIPLRSGFSNQPPFGCSESFAATAQVKAYLFNDASKRRILLEDRSIPSAALEFGGDCQSQVVETNSLSVGTEECSQSPAESKALKKTSHGTTKTSSCA